MRDEQEIQDIGDFVSDINDATFDLGLKKNDTIGDLIAALEESCDDDDGEGD